MTRTVLVTGGAGFIGSHLCDRLLERDGRVVCLDNLVTGRMANIADAMEHDRFTFVQHDVAQPYFSDEPVDAVFHLASPASPAGYAANPIQTLKAGALGTYQMLGFAKRHRARFLLTSTSEVYGDPLVSPQPEDYWGNVNPVGPRSVYDEAKRFAEAITMAYAREHNVDVRIARIFNTYGPRMSPQDGRVVSNFLVQALRGEPLTLFGDGLQTRCFCYVDDLVEGLLRLEASDVVGPINLGSDHEITMRELADHVSRAVGAEVQTADRPLPEDDPRKRRPDLARARRLLGWAPTVSLEEGLRRTLRHYESELAKVDA